MRSRILASFLVFSLLILGLSSAAKADIVFPAKLQLVETSPGIYSVVFVLPVIDGKVLKAKPLLPQASEMLTEPTISGNENFKILNFEVKIPLENLHGQMIGIEGLAGTQVDILLTIQTLDGRSYEEKLSPVNPFIIVPSPASSFELITQAIWEGIQLLVNQIYLLLFFVIFLPKMRFRFWVYAGILASLGLVIGRVLGQLKYLNIPDYLAPVSFAILLLVFSLKKPSGKTLAISKALIFVFLVIFGISLGEIGQFALELNITGETLLERNAFTAFFAIGAFLGILIYLVFARESRYMYQRFLSKRIQSRQLSFWLGIFSLAYLIYQASLIWNVPSMFPPIPALLLLLVISSSRFKLSKVQALVFFGFIATGILVGFFIAPPLFTYPIVGALLGICLILQFFKTQVKAIFLLPLVAIAGFAGAWYLGDFVNTGLSFAIAQAAGMILILALTFLLAKLILPKSKNTELDSSERIISIVLLSFLLIFWTGNELMEFLDTFSSGLSLGKINMPILSLGAFILAFFVWPRYRKIHQSLNVQRKKPIRSLALLIIGLFAISMTWQLTNPFYDANAPEKTQAKEILNDVLDRTYRAFNLEDENKLFEVLDASVTANLVDDIYLDSRRRLNVGLREGSEVLVQEVKVEELGELKEVTAGEEGFEYPATWTVTARVKHLQHIHYRQNRYIGQVKLLLEEGNWKIAKIVLTSEDRTIIAGQNL